MRKIAIVGGSKGIGFAILQKLVEDNQIINISRSSPNLRHVNLTHHTCDVLVDNLPDLEELDALIYCPGSINLKPISRLKLDDFKNDFEINVVGAVKAVQKYLPQLKKGSHPSVLLFSTVASKLGMPFHASVAAEEWRSFSTLCAYSAGLHGQQYPSCSPDELGAILRVSSTRNYLQSGYALHRTRNQADGYIKGQS